MIPEFSANVASYCEHVYWLRPDQPFNVGSNIAWLALASLIFWGRRHMPGWTSWLLVALLMLVAITGMVWHASMAPVALAAAFVPAAALISLLAFLICRHALYLPLWQCFPVVAALLTASALTRIESHWVARDAAPLLPLIGALFLAGTLSAFVRHGNAGLHLIMASFWLASGFLVMSLDGPACTIFETGTHFVWHILGAVAVFCITRAVVVGELERHDGFEWGEPEYAEEEPLSQPEEA